MNKNLIISIREEVKVAKKTLYKIVDHLLIKTKVKRTLPLELKRKKMRF